MLVVAEVSRLIDVFGRWNLMKSMSGGPKLTDIGVNKENQKVKIAESIEPLSLAAMERFGKSLSLM